MLMLMQLVNGKLGLNTNLLGFYDWRGMKNNKLLDLKHLSRHYSEKCSTIRRKVEGEELVKKKYSICSCKWHMGRKLEL